MAQPATSTTCYVCTLEVEGYMEAHCDTCGNLYHLNSRADLPGDDCGQVWINEEHLSLQFACNTCLNPPATMSIDDVVDLQEAAQAAGVEPAALESASARGALKHRRTASGILLFRLGDVLEFVQTKR